MAARPVHHFAARFWRQSVDVPAKVLHPIVLMRAVTHDQDDHGDDQRDDECDDDNGFQSVLPTADGRRRSDVVLW